MKRLIFVFTALLLLTFLFQVEAAQAEEGRHYLGVQAGQVGLTGDVGSAYGSALGVGAFFNYAASDFLEFQLSWLTSHHSSNNLALTQNSYALILQYNLDQLDIFTPYIEGGAEFASHVQDIPGLSGNASYNTTAFGLDLGIGAKVDLGKSFMTGLDFTYHNIFDASATPPGLSAVKAIQSYFTVMLRFGFVFGGSGGSYLNRPDQPKAP
jgi:opacity protein-like surface antigen